MGRIFGIACAVTLHVGFILFGGLLFQRDKDERRTLQDIDLLSTDDVADEKKQEQPLEEPAEQSEQLATEEEPPPDAAEIIRNLELSSAASAPALEAASLSAIEQALGGQGGVGDFADALSFSSGGRIGGMAEAGVAGDELERAFSLSEIDQKPRPVMQAAPLYPAEMRGKKLEAVVTVIFVVDASGRVANPRVEKSSHAAFSKPAVDAVKQWKFEPAVKSGQRVSCKMRIPIRFQPSAQS